MKPSDNRLVAGCTDENGTWELLHRTNRDSPPWRNIVLLRLNHRTRKYTLGWNGERLANNSELTELKRKFPLMVDWLNQTLPKIEWP